jgi:hypothetical protein
MTLLIGLLVLAFLFFLPGYLTTRALFLDGEALSSGERLFIPIVISILISTWVGLILAEIGRFSLALLCILIALYCGLAWLVQRRAPLSSPLASGKESTPLSSPLMKGGRRGVRVDWVFIAILALGALLAAHPAEYFLGNYDAGTYVNVGANIARTGAIAIYDPLVQSLPPDPGRQFFWDLVNPFMLYTQVRFPGFFVADAPRGLVLPQFLHLYPVWLAIFDAALGLRWGLYATPLIGLLGSVAAYFVARTLFGRSLARLAFFLLVIDVPQFWFARYPVAEAMTQFLLLTGMYAFLRSPALVLTQEYNSGPNEPSDPSPASDLGFPLIAGVAFAEIFLARADAILLLAPLAIYALLVIFVRKWRRAHWALFLSFGVILAHAVVHTWVFSPDYVYFQYSHFLRMKNLDKLLPGGTGLPSAQDLFHNPTSLWPLLAVGLIGLVVLFVIDRIVQAGLKRWGAPLFTWQDRYSVPLRWIGVGLIVILFVFAYFLAPHPGTLFAYVGGETPLGQSANLIKLGWYLSPFGLILAVIGAAVVMRRDLSWHNLFFFGTGALFSAFYLEELYSNPHYIYTARHYIPLVIPFFILLAACALQFLWRTGTRVRAEGEAAPPRAHMGALPMLARLTAAGALGLWLIYNVYAMGLIDASRATGIAIRLPLLTQTARLGPLRLDPIGDSIVGVQELGGALDQIQALANQIDPNAVIIFSNNRDEPALIATPLHFLFNRDALVARFNQPNGEKIAAMIDNWRAQGREVILAYGTNGGKMAVPGYSLSPLGHFALDVQQWAFAYQYMPRSAWRVNLNYALYHAVPSNASATYPFTIDFGGDDYPALVGGFLERATGATTRSIGVNPDPSAPSTKPRSLTATLRLPAYEDSTSDPGQAPSASSMPGIELGAQKAPPAALDLALTARAPADGMDLTVRSGKSSFGAFTLTREFATYHFSLPRANLQRDGDSYLIELGTPAYAAPGGLFLGAELKKAVLSSQ